MPTMPTTPTVPTVPPRTTEPARQAASHRASVEAVSSWARRVGEEVKVVLTLSDDLSDRVGDGLTRRRVWLRLRSPGAAEQWGTRALATVTPGAPGANPRIEASVPAESLTPGTWVLSLRVGRGGPIVPLEARLLMTDTTRQPLALLSGPVPLTRLPEPRPR